MRAEGFCDEQIHEGSGAGRHRRIKARLAADSELSAWNISVDTTGGVVTPAGTVATPGLIGRAVLLALESDGVNEVISTLQVK